MDKQTEEKQLANDLIEMTIRHKPYCLVEFTVKAGAPFVQKIHDQAVKAVAKETTLPGFRKGKAPDELIRKNFVAAIEKKWSQSLGEEVFRECEKLANIPPLPETRIHFNMKNHSLESGAEMSFQFESEPEIPSIDFGHLKLQPEEKEVLDQTKIDEIIHKIRLFFAKWQPVTDRSVQIGDFIIVDLDTIEEEPPSKVFSNTRLEVSGSTMAQWMRNIVIGMQSGESKEGVSEPDDDASEEDKQHFKPKKVKVSLKSIEEPTLPPVDDEFAKKMGAESAQVMKDRLNILLSRRFDEEQRIKYRNQLTELLLGTYFFDVPGSILRNELEHRFKNLYQNPSFRKHYEALNEDGKKTEVDKLKIQAEEALRLFYLCKKVATEHNITVSEKDLSQHVDTPLDAMFADRDLLQTNKTEEQRNLLMSKILLTKSQDFILDKILH